MSKNSVKLLYNRRMPAIQFLLYKMRPAHLYNEYDTH